MNSKPVNAAQNTLAKIMDCIPSVHSIGEKIFLSEQAHHMRARLDAADDALRDEHRRLVRELAQEQNSEKRVELDVKLQEIEKVRDRYEAIDDELHTKSHSYTKAISKLYDTAYTLLKSACSTLDSLIEYLSGIFSKRRSKDVG